MPAKLPPNLLQPPKRRLRDLNVGESAHIWTADMGATESGECYVDPGAVLMERGISTVQVTRREDGFHIVVIAKGTTWSPGKTPQSYAVPVTSVCEEYDPLLDDPLEAFTPAHPAEP